MGHYLDSWLTVGVAVKRTEEDKGCSMGPEQTCTERQDGIRDNRVTMGSEQERK
jgi:hypothetical protein